MADFGGINGAPIVRGDTLVWDLAITDESGVVIDLTGCVLRMTAKVLNSNADGSSVADVSAVFQVSSPGNGITFTDAVNGLAKITVPAGKMYGLAYYPYDVNYDVQLTDGVGKIFTVCRGVLTVDDDSTIST